MNRNYRAALARSFWRLDVPLGRTRRERQYTLR